MNFVIRLTPKSKPTWANPEESIGERLFSIRNGKYTCWEAVGRAQRAWNTILPEINRFFQLDEYAHLFHDISKYDFGFEFYMVGREKRTAFPIVFVRGKDKSTRKTIRKLIKENGFLDKYPGMEVGDRSGFPEPLAGEAGAEDARLIVYTPSDDNRILGRRLLVRGVGNTMPRKATGGPIVWINEKPFQLTVSHVFEDSDEQSTSPDHEDSDSTSDEWSFDGDSGTDSDEEDAPSGGSRTPDELISRDSEDDAQGSGDSILGRSGAPSILTSSLVFSPSLEASTSSLDETEKAETQQSTRDGVEYGPPRARTAAAGDLAPDKMLGTIQFSSMRNDSGSSLDYALVKVLPQSVGGILQVSEYLSRCARLSFASPLQSHNIKVSVWTSSSQPIPGTLSATSSYWRTKRSKSLQEVIPLRVSGVLDKGDCGAAVIDMSTGHFYGLVVAGTPGTGFGFVIPAWHVFDDIEQRFGSKAVLSPPQEISNDLFYGIIQPVGTTQHLRPVWAQARSEVEENIAVAIPLPPSPQPPPVQTLSNPEWRLTASLPLAPSLQGTNERVEVFSRGIDGKGLRIVHIKVDVSKGSKSAETIYFPPSGEGAGSVALLYPFLRIRNLNTPYSILLSHSSRERYAYDFQSPQEALKFQELLTGYNVVHSFRDIDCLATRREARTLLGRPKQFTGRGEFQIWSERTPRPELSDHLTPQVGQWNLVSRLPADLHSDKDDVASPRRVGTRGGVSSLAGAVIYRLPACPILVAFLEESQSGSCAVLSVPISSNVLLRERENPDKFLVDITERDDRYFEGTFNALKTESVALFDARSIVSEISVGARKVKYRYLSLSFPDEKSRTQFVKSAQEQQILYSMMTTARRQLVLGAASLSSIPLLSSDSGSRASSVSGGPETPQQLPELSGADVAPLALDLGDLREEDEDAWLAKGKP